MKTHKLGLGLCALLLSGAVDASQACTGIRLDAQDGAVVHARTLEFGNDLKSEVMVVPRGYERTGTTPDGKPGRTWKAKYASVGANGMGEMIMFDGLNEAGLAAGLFYFPNSAGYMTYSAENADRAMAPWELGSWMLENFATVEEVKAHIGDVVIPAVVLPAMGFAPEVHFVVHDATGQSIVVEYVDGKLDLHDNPLGVITNSPAFGWHMTNLRNYVNFSMDNVPPVTIGGVKLLPTGMGTGMLGMPGDFTPPSRFVRAVAFSHSVFPSGTGPEAVLGAFHILNQFDIPKGSAREGEKDEHGNVIADYTQWTSASDLAAKRFHFRTYDNSQIRAVDLMQMDLDAKDIVTFSMQGDEVIKVLNP